MAEQVREEFVEIAGARVSVMRAGRGAPLLFLHGAGGRSWTPLHDRLAERFDVMAPEHPGFGRSALPEWMLSIADLALFYLDFMEALDLRDVHLAGHSLGGWLAGEIAIRNTSRLASVSLLAPAGIAAPEEPFGDIFLWSREQGARAQFFDQTLAEKRLAAPADLDLVLQNKTATARLAWSPRLCNPQLHYWLHRIDKPTLLLWGRQDRVIPYACEPYWKKGLAASVSRVIEECGHGLHNEKPDAASQHMIAFIEGSKE